MKSEERHNLATDSLAGWTDNFPQFIRRHLTEILLALAIIAAAYSYYHYRMGQRSATAATVSGSLSAAWNVLQRLDAVDQQLAQGVAQGLDPTAARGEMITIAKQAEQQVNEAVRSVIAEADPSNKATLANAWLVSGELYWKLANLSLLAPSKLAPAESPTSAPAEVPTTSTTTSATQPAQTGPTTTATEQATTQPSKTPEEYLTLAVDSYETVVRDYADQTGESTKARFGLAAIAENRHNLHAARDQYKTIIETENVISADKSLAEQRIVALGDLQNPLLVLPATQPVTLPPAAGTDDATQPFDIGELLKPSSQPSSQPQDPSANPSSNPSANSSSATQPSGTNGGKTAPPASEKPPASVPAATQPAGDATPAAPAKKPPASKVNEQ